MKPISKALKKGAIGTVAAGAMAMASATPATAQYRDRDYDRNDGISAGEIIAGAVILGGIAAVAGSIGNRDRYDRRGTYGYGYTTPRSAVEQCVAAASRDARRYGYRDARVTQIRDVDNRRDGYRVRGNIVVDASRGYYGNRYDNNYRYNGRYDNYRYGGNYDQGRFTCEIRRGRIVDLDFSGIRGLR